MKNCLFAFLCIVQGISYAKTPLLVVTEDLWPFNYIEDNQIKGSATRLVKHALGKADFEYTIELLPWARSYKLALSQPNVLIYTINHTPSRDNKFHWLYRLPVLVQSNFYALKSAKLSNASTKEIKNLRVATLIDSVNDAYISNHDFKHVSRVSHITQTVGMLKRERVDIVISSENALKKALKDTNISMLDIEKIGVAFTSHPSIAMSLQTPLATVNKFKQLFETMERHDDICDIMKIEQAVCILYNSPQSTHKIIKKD